jgi:hypothetical protein
MDIRKINLFSVLHSFKAGRKVRYFYRSETKKKNKEKERENGNKEGKKETKK